jgi:hypothetical protein
VAYAEQLWASVCMRGHVGNAHLPEVASTAAKVAETRGRSRPHTLPPFCGYCGARILMNCPSCDALILGKVQGIPVLGWRPAVFCWSCGGPYPWATREQRVGKLYNLLDFEELDEAQRLTVIEHIAVLTEPVDEVTDEQRVRAGERLRSLVPRLWEAGLPIIQSVLTAGAKQKLGLPP